jgi:hypothetical protein
VDVASHTAARLRDIIDFAPSTENIFVILDEGLTVGDRAATPQSLVNYEAHRSEDYLINAISCYIKGQMSDGQRALRDLQIGAILGQRTSKDGDAGTAAAPQRTHQPRGANVSVAPLV